MTITKKRLWLVVLVVALVACLATAGMLTAFAVTATDTIQYPFRTGGVHTITLPFGRERRKAKTNGSFSV